MMRTAAVVAVLVCASAATAAETRNVAIVLYPGVELLDFAGPGEVFSSAGTGAFHVYTVAASAQPLVSQGFVKITPDYAIDGAPRPDVIVIPGGNVGAVINDPKMMAWLKKGAAESEITMSVCNGAIALAQASLLDGLKATTHWSALPRLRKFGKVTVVPDERFTDNGRIVTTQGVSAGIDGALHVVERLIGVEAAWADAHYMMYRWEPATLSQPAKEELRPWIEHNWGAVERVYGSKLAGGGKDLVALARLGIAEEELGEHARAVTTLERAIALGSRDADAFDDLAQAKVALGHFAEGAKIYERETALRPVRVQPWVRLSAAKAWLRAGNKAAALAALGAAVDGGELPRRALEDDTILAGLGADPHFVQLLQRAP
jgi:putative intracellular protease/amidase